MLVSPGLFQNELTLLWSRPADSPSLLLRPSRSTTAVSFLLLLCGGVRANPGPAAHSQGAHVGINCLQCGSFNVRSAVHKAAHLHDIICNRGLNILALQETWFSSDTPPAIKADVALPRFFSMHVNRNESIIGKSGWGGRPSSTVMTSTSTPWRSVHARRLRLRSSSS